jgi:hypothetical protein
MAVALAGCAGGPCRELVTEEELETLSGLALEAGIDLRVASGCEVIYAEDAADPRILAPVAEVDVVAGEEAAEGWLEEARRDGLDVSRVGRGTWLGAVGARADDGGDAVARTEARVAELFYRSEEGSAVEEERPPPEHHVAVALAAGESLRVRVHRTAATAEALGELLPRWRRRLAGTGGDLRFE